MHKQPGPISDWELPIPHPEFALVMFGSHYPPSQENTPWPRVTQHGTHLFQGLASVVNFGLARLANCVARVHVASFLAGAVL